MSKSKRVTVEVTGADIPMEQLDLTLVNRNATTAKFFSEGYGVITITGRNLSFTDEVLSGGTVDTIKIINIDRELVETISNVNEKAAAHYADGASNTEVFLDTILTILNKNLDYIGSKKSDQLASGAGNDVIDGRGGADVLQGGAGNDRLTGGAGNDYFQFGTGSGQDIITDFDATAKGGQDHIYAEFTDELLFTKSGKDTIIDFGDGDTLRLLDVKPSQIDASDFFFPVAP